MNDRTELARGGESIRRAPIGAWTWIPPLVACVVVLASGQIPGPLLRRTDLHDLPKEAVSVLAIALGALLGAGTLAMAGKMRTYHHGEDIQCGRS